MNATEIQEFGYRRGLVLGFTAAEVIILLLFLMLLIMGFFLEDFDRQSQEIAPVALEDFDSNVKEVPVEAWITRIELLATELEIATIRIQESETLAAEAKEESSLTQVKLAKISEELAEEKTKQQRTKNLIDQLQAELHQKERSLKDQVKHLSESAKIYKKNEDLEEKLRKAQADLEKMEGEFATVNAGNENHQETIADLEAKFRDVQRRVSSAPEDSKGQDSPCLFEKIVRNNGKTRERPIYLFDIKITDDLIYVEYPSSNMVRHIEANKQLNMNRTEVDQLLDELSIDRGHLNRNLTFDEFIPAFEEFKRAGQIQRVRTDRRCTFWVAIWDHTSATNKRGYKQAHNQRVQQVFNTYEFEEDPWPHK